MSGATAVVEFTGPNGEKARVFCEKGQVRHETAPGRQGMAAFNEIVRWKGGTVSEIAEVPFGPQTIEMDWQQLLMEAVRSVDEAGAQTPKKSRKKKGNPKKFATNTTPKIVQIIHYAQQKSARAYSRDHSSRYLFLLCCLLVC